MSENPFDQLEKYFNNRFDKLEAKIDELKLGNNLLKDDPDPFLRSIKDISAFLGCSDPHSQDIKHICNDVFIALGRRKFIVEKVKLLQEIQIKERKLKTK